jgi:dTDP-4-dehydrorhamnose reductase
MRILVTGGSGQVGRELLRTLQPLGELFAPDVNELDFASVSSIRQVLRAVRPRIIVNAAAYTAVDRAESEPALAMAVNGTAPGILAEGSAGAGRAARALFDRLRIRRHQA